MVPVVNKVMRPTFRRANDPRATRNECWQAETPDGQWFFERVEGVRGTPWALWHVPTRTIVAYAPSLSKCRRYVASGAVKAPAEAVA